jgi:hypothetical protein
VRALEKVKVVAKVRALFVHLTLRLVLSALIVKRRVVEFAIVATVQIGTAGQAGLAPPDSFDHTLVAIATVAMESHASSLSCSLRDRLIP